MLSSNHWLSFAGYSITYQSLQLLSMILIQGSNKMKEMDEIRSGAPQAPPIRIRLYTTLYLVLGRAPPGCPGCTVCEEHWNGMRLLSRSFEDLQHLAAAPLYSRIRVVARKKMSKYLAN
jgi:hypothetical protein